MADETEKLATPKGKRSKTKKNRKFNRNRKRKCAIYRAENRRAKNKARKAARILKGFKKSKNVSQLMLA